MFLSFKKLQIIFVFCVIMVSRVSGEELKRLIKGADGVEMVLVPAGSFFIGSNEFEDASPLQIRCLPSFYIDRYEISNAQYARFVSETGYPPPPHWGGNSPPPGEEMLPVTNVSWFDAMRYAIWAGKRLPTEAEWEKACRGTDGRVFPWGNVDDLKKRNLSTDVLQPIYSYPDGVSPYGCYNMSGNVWEWTADWYDSYPFSNFKSIHFGKKYKVIRGGGACDIYPIANTGNCSQRARLLPYGYYDGVGFRCVKDVNPANAPYDPLKLLEEAENHLHRPLPSAYALSYEEEFESYLGKKCIPIQIEGKPGEESYVRVGVPFPKGFLYDLGKLQISTINGSRPLQTKPLSFWDDGSFSWVLLDFPAKQGEKVNLKILQKEEKVVYPYALKCEEKTRFLNFYNGRLRLTFSKEFLMKVEGVNGEQYINGMYLSLKAYSVRGETTLRSLPPETMEIEKGDLHSIVHFKGRFFWDDSSPSNFRYEIEIHIYAQSNKIRLCFIVTNFAPRENNPVKVLGGNLGFILGREIRNFILKVDGKEEQFIFDKDVELVQEDQCSFLIKVDGKNVKKGIRAEGLGMVNLGKKRLALSTKYFWEDHPIALFATSNSIGLNFWAGKDAFEWEGGLAKSYDICLDLLDNNAKYLGYPQLIAILPPAWIAGTKALGDILPKGEESLRLFPYWEAMLEESMRKWARGMATGMRDFGDAYYGGPYKGKNSYANLEYDVPLNFLIQFIRTGQRWFFDVAEAQVRHQADIDIDHYTGRQWKHSPLHTTTEADLGHIFLRGLLLHYLLTGERRSLESAERIGKWLAPKVEKLEDIGNERQIGWSLYALSELYKVTRNKIYLISSEKAALELAKEQSPTGRFKIRWDNRISFFNGIAMRGLLNVYALSNKEEIYDAVLKLALRTLGFYPEYSCRTLDALVYLAERTKDPRFWDLLERTWETSMEFLLKRNVIAGGTFSWQFLPFAAKHRFPCVISSVNIPLPFSTNSWRSLRLRGVHIRLFFKKGGNVMFILEGINQGQVSIYDRKGKLLNRYELLGEQMFKRVNLSVEKDLLVTLSSPLEAIWEVHYEETTNFKIYDPQFVNLPHIYPKALFNLKKGAKEIKLRLKIEGEGFHKAIIYAPGGEIVAAEEKFIDLGDTHTYELEINIPFGSDVPREGWAIELYECEVLKAEGLSPFLEPG